MRQGSTVSVIDLVLYASGLAFCAECPGFHKGTDPNAAESAKVGMRNHAARNTELMELGVKLFQKPNSL